MARSRVELFEAIRRDRRIDGLSIRELADKHGVHRRTVRQALANAVPPPRKAYPGDRRTSTPCSVLRGVLVVLARRLCQPGEVRLTTSWRS